jgi:uncharacterized membrane protein
LRALRETKNKKTMIKKLIFLLVIVFIAIQFYPRTNNNISKNKSVHTLALSETTSDSVLQILKSSCYDCHSNNTKYPWYAGVQPLAWWINDHVVDGKKHFNLDDFANYNLRKQYHKMEEVMEQVNEGEMPLSSYRLIHGEAKLTQEERAVLASWAQSVLDSMKATYPIDSLIKKN